MTNATINPNLDLSGPPAGPEPHAGECPMCGRENERLYDCIACHALMCIHCVDEACERVPDLMIQDETILLCPSCMKKYNEYLVGRCELLRRRQGLRRG